MDNHFERSGSCTSKQKLLLTIVVVALLGGSVMGGYYFGARNLQGQLQESVQDLPPFLVTIHTKEHLTLLTLIEEQKESKTSELLFLLLMGDLRAVNDLDHRSRGQRISVEDKKELCALITPLENLGHSKLIASLPDAKLAPSFRAEVNTLKESCVRRQYQNGSTAH